MLGKEPNDVVRCLPPPKLGLLSRKLFLNLDTIPELLPLLPSDILLACFSPYNQLELLLSSNLSSALTLSPDLLTSPPVSILFRNQELILSPSLLLGDCLTSLRVAVSDCWLSDLIFTGTSLSSCSLTLDDNVLPQRS